ncbi:hypothetical protein NP233_g7303 [Leucocoprinus birnbaumii]|uniref:O-methyltransferase domain-containing protein n=1 Tax=Leucocoprinus birnbaumii TaxID=56174 RepID=A0AAD5VPJ0_9AGAR|nr:hypothetical protein NP233_g7303 [Leucocoprinus birnbaumii]
MAPEMESMSSLSALLTIINTNTQQLQSLYIEYGYQTPSLDAPFHSSPLDTHVKALELSQLIVAAANNLIAIVRPPRATIREFSSGMFQSAPVGFAVDVDIPEILDEAPNKELHVKEIAMVADCDSSHAARILRYLATRHIFREVTPDVFTNNRISSALIKSNGKTVAELKAKPLEKYDDSGLAAVVGCITGDGLKSSSALIDFLKSSGKAGTTPCNMAWGTDKSLFNWFSESEDGWRMRRFMAHMKSRTKEFDSSIFQNAYTWQDLDPTDVVIDVGGNVGMVTLGIAKVFSKPKYVVQDLSSVMVEAKEVMSSSSNVHCDNTHPQPIKGAAVYFLRFIIHDWPDAKCIKILRNIRDAASASSKLILFEHVAPYACEDVTEYEGKIERRRAPWPLVPNIGKDEGGPSDNKFGYASSFSRVPYRKLGAGSSNVNGV